MEWINNDYDKPIKSWCREIEPGAMQQAINLAKHSQVFHHVALMPDCHEGYGMPIGGVIACPHGVIPYAVGVDIGCGMCAVKTSLPVERLQHDMINQIVRILGKMIPMGFDTHSSDQKWQGFDINENLLERAWNTHEVWSRAKRSLGTLGGGNHFIEIQMGDDGCVWLMLHSGSRHLGKSIADYYHHQAVELCSKRHEELPTTELSFLPLESHQGQDYINDMNFALEYARENRKRMLESFKNVFSLVVSKHEKFEYEMEVNIHHNYAAQEHHFGRDVWVHRKGATSAMKNQLGIIPGSMGSASYIVEGLGNEDSFMSCSHGAGRVMGRKDASRSLTVGECDKAMRGIVFEGWKKIGFGKLKGKYDLGEAPQSYKDIDVVIAAQLDLIKPLVKLKPLGVLKG